MCTVGYYQHNKESLDAQISFTSRKRSLSLQESADPPWFRDVDSRLVEYKLDVNHRCHKPGKFRK